MHIRSGKVAAFPLNSHQRLQVVSEFYTYLQTGYYHIADLNGYDHMLYILTLVVGFSIWHWKKVLLAVTAFTIGHSITLALATLDLVHIPQEQTEFYISITILISAIYAAIRAKSEPKISAMFYFLTMGFGLIHGLGFSSFLSAGLEPDESIFAPLLGFNIGLEIGQLLIVLAIMIINLVVEHVLDIKKANWVVFCSGFASSLALLLIFENKFW
ncbi:MAG: HupE/UreJ family protein [Bacteroidetes bacterium]|nr:HupE/UreJ family protein [Bacteroidota bacterium]